MTAALTSQKIISVRCELSRGGGLYFRYDNGHEVWRSYSWVLRELGRPEGERLFLLAWSNLDSWIDV